MVLRGLVPLLALGIAAACAAPVREEPPVPWTAELLAGGRVLLVTAAVEPGKGVSPAGLPVTVRLQEDALVCTRHVGGPVIRVLTFERAGARSAYGVYGLLGAKNGLPLCRPLHGDPIRWEDRDHRAGLAYQLELAGLARDAAASLVDAEDAAWFGAGLRVLFTLEDSAAAPYVSAESAAHVRVLVVAIEIPLERR